MNANNVKPAEVHGQIVQIYGENIMSDGMATKWVRQFNDGQTNDELVKKVNVKILENRWITIRMLCV